MITGGKANIKDNYFGINDEYDAVNGSMYVDNIEDVKNYANEIICFYSVIGKIKDFPITSIIVHNFTFVKLVHEQRRGM